MWSSNAKFRISRQRLSFDSARRIYHNKDYWHPRTGKYHGANLRDCSPGRSNFWMEADSYNNPITGKPQECYQFLMYRTHIHKWWADGTYQSVYYDSASTRDFLSTYGPVHVFNHRRCRFQDHTRFGGGYWQEGAKNFPYGGGITIAPDGEVRDYEWKPIQDVYYRMKHESTKERTKIRNHFRDNATSRILLGEFGDAFYSYETNKRKPFGRRGTGWMARIPPLYSGIAKAFFAGAKHDVIEPLIHEYTKWVHGPVRENENGAMLACIEAMADQILSEVEWEYRKITRTYRINIHDGWSKDDYTEE